jgi:hypothetical protein
MQYEETAAAARNNTEGEAEIKERIRVILAEIAKLNVKIKSHVVELPSNVFSRVDSGPKYDKNLDERKTLRKELETLNAILEKIKKARGGTRRRRRIVKRRRRMTQRKRRS